MLASSKLRGRSSPSKACNAPFRDIGYRLPSTCSTVQFSNVPTLDQLLNFSAWVRRYLSRTGLQSTVYGVRCKVYGVRCKVYGVRCTVYGVR